MPVPPSITAAAVIDSYMTVEEFAAAARTTPSTVHHWRHHGKGPRGVKRGRRVLYRAAEVAAWLAGDAEEDPDAA